MKKFLVSFSIVALITVLILASCWGDLDKIPHRDEGIFAIETLTTEGEVTGVGTSYTYANGRRRRRQHNLSIYLEVIDDFTGMHLPEEELENYHVGDIVEVVREVYYLKPGFRVFRVDSIGPKGVITCVEQG